MNEPIPEEILAHYDALYPVVSYGKPELRMLERGTFMGTWVCSKPKKYRWILSRDVEVRRGITAPDLARWWITHTYKLPLRRRKTQDGKGWPNPLAAIPGEYTDCAYVDIAQTYRHIVELVGYDVDYAADRYMLQRPVKLPGWLPKVGYSSLVAMSASYLSAIRYWDGETIAVKRPRNQFYNPCLWSVTRDILASVYGDLKFRMPVLYANTDGFIVDCADVPRALDTIARWGFTARVKAAGPTEIFGVGAYRVGNVETRNPHTVRVARQSETPGLSQRRWLHERCTAARNMIQCIDK